MDRADKEKQMEVRRNKERSGESRMEMRNKEKQ